MKQPRTIAIIRGLYGAALSFGLAFLPLWAMQDLKTAAIAGGMAGLSYLAARGGVEGYIDQRRS